MLFIACNGVSLFSFLHITLMNTIQEQLRLFFFFLIRIFVGDNNFLKCNRHIDFSNMFLFCFVFICFGVFKKPGKL